MADPGTADVQAELQDYLNSKNINTLFIQVRRGAGSWFETRIVAILG